MLQRAELKTEAKQLIRNNLHQVICVSALLSVVMFFLGIADETVSILGVLLDGVLLIPFCFFMLRTWRSGTAHSEDFFDSFYNVVKWALASLWQYLWIALWLFVFILPGIVKMLSYSQYYFILADNPDADIRQALKTSMRMTKGHLGSLFLLDLSFLNWLLLFFALMIPCAVVYAAGLVTNALLLGSLAAAVGMVWMYPFFCGTMAGVYEELKREALESGACAPEEFGLYSAEDASSAADQADAEAGDAAEDAGSGSDVRLDIAAVNERLSAIEAEMSALSTAANADAPLQEDAEAGGPASSVRDGGAE